MRLKNKITTLLFFLLVFKMYSMPGFTSPIKDSSGEFVYYRDYSFSEESYIGILYYSEDSVQIRYYRPLNKEKLIPEKEISLLFSINPDLDHLELTGELIMSTILPDTEDVDIVNYLHDIMYEFSSRRIKEKDILPQQNIFLDSREYGKKGKKSTQNYDQFGGIVTIIYDPIIPIFNIKSILNDKNEPVFSCVTFGCLQDSSDSTFDKFAGFSENKSEKEQKQSQISKKSKTTDFQTEDNQFVSLDSNWTQAMDNLWLCGNESLLTINSIPYMKDASEIYDLIVLRKLLQSSSGSYTNLSNIEISFDSKQNSYKITQFSYQPSTENKIINKKIISKNSSTNGFYYFALTIFEDYYYQNKNYYEKIIKSYKIKN